MQADLGEIKGKNIDEILVYFNIIRNKVVPSYSWIQYPQILPTTDLALFFLANDGHICTDNV